MPPCGSTTVFSASQKKLTCFACRFFRCSEEAEPPTLLSLALLLSLLLALTTTLLLLLALTTALLLLLLLLLVVLRLALRLAGLLLVGHLILLTAILFGGTKGDARGVRWVRHDTTMTTMKLLLLDTETNGLPTNRYAPPSCTEAFPAVLQLSWSLFTVVKGGKGLRLEESKDRSIALPPGVPYDAGAGAIHGITEEAARQGSSALEVFTELAAVLQRVDCVVAHNLSFDRPVIRAAAWAVGLRDLWPPPQKVQEFCTMRSTRDLCCLGGGSVEGVYKLPSLNELYNFLYGHTYDVSGSGVKMHTSRADTHCLSRCVEGLLRRGHLTVSESRLVLVPFVSSSAPLSSSYSPTA